MLRRSPNNNPPPQLKPPCLAARPSGGVSAHSHAQARDAARGGGERVQRGWGNCALDTKQRECGGERLILVTSATVKGHVEVAESAESHVMWRAGG